MTILVPALRTEPSTTTGSRTHPHIVSTETGLDYSAFFKGILPSLFHKTLVQADNLTVHCRNFLGDPPTPRKEVSIDHSLISALQTACVGDTQGAGTGQISTSKQYI